MSKYIVCWSEPGNLSPRQQKKIFENPIAANWFASELKKVYNWVICIESKNLEE